MHSHSSKPALFREGLIGLLVVKAILHLTAILNGYGLHRDEYLYLAEGHHPMWGYMEGPPVIGWVAGISQFILGGTIWAAKLPVLAVGLLSLWLLCELVREVGGVPKPSDTNNVKIRSVELCHNAVCVKNWFRVFLFEGILDHVEGRNDAFKLAV